MSRLRREIDYLRSAAAVRDRCNNILEHGLAGDLEHFCVELRALERVADRVADTTRATYPTLEIPVHGRLNHLRAGNIDRPRQLGATAIRQGHDPAVALVDLVVISVLVDAGAGADWTYAEADHRYTRSEGLAVASYHLVADGRLSSSDDELARVDAVGLQAIDEADLAEAFQVTGSNPLVGLDGRVELLSRLGHAIDADRERFEPAEGGPARPGGLVHHFAQAATGGQLPAAAVLGTLTAGLADIWPGRIALDGVNLGDTWRHPAAGGRGATASLVPFHKLTQWLAYSLIEPLGQAGIEVIEIDELTGLAEYRNGGLLVDLGVLEPRDPDAGARSHQPGDEIVVEWRALTVALLDRLAPLVRDRLALTDAQLPLAQVIEGGTWRAGREVAAELRQDGGPPLAVESDGTVF